MRPNRTYMWNMHVEANLLNVVTYSTIYSIKSYKKRQLLHNLSYGQIKFMLSVSGSFSCSFIFTRRHWKASRQMGNGFYAEPAT